MVYQKTVETNGRHGNVSNSGDSRSVNLGSNLSDVTHDVTQLLELQAKLLLVDASEAQQKLKAPAISLIVGLLIVLCSLPLFFVATAHGLILAGLQAYLAYGIVGIAGIAGGALLLLLGAKRMKRSTSVFERSHAEFARNLDWFKHILRQRSSKAC